MSFAKATPTFEPTWVDGLVEEEQVVGAEKSTWRLRVPENHVAAPSSRQPPTGIELVGPRLGAQALDLTLTFADDDEGPRTLGLWRAEDIVEYSRRLAPYATQTVSWLMGPRRQRVQQPLPGVNATTTSGADGSATPPTGDAGPGEGGGPDGQPASPPPASPHPSGAESSSAAADDDDDAPGQGRRDHDDDAPRGAAAAPAGGLIEGLAASGPASFFLGGGGRPEEPSAGSSAGRDP
mmetsp:Transcript_11095/g.44950  ORF Transcript_11095/g.44950 Transcript_11095/m.44950 type:complete len:237 (-) Transcript_11095:1400-2110(-)